MDLDAYQLEELLEKELEDLDSESEAEEEINCSDKSDADEDQNDFLSLAWESLTNSKDQKSQMETELLDGLLSLGYHIETTETPVEVDQLMEELFDKIDAVIIIEEEKEDSIVAIEVPLVDEVTVQQTYFVDDLEREMDEREDERKERNRQLEQARARYFIQFEACVIIQKYTRMKSCWSQKALKQRSILRIQNCFKMCVNGKRGLVILFRMKEDAIQASNIYELSREDKLAAFLRTWHLENQKLMELEDMLVQSLMNRENYLLALNRKEMTEEDACVRKLVAFEKQMEMLEGSLMYREDTRSIMRSRAMAREQSFMQSEDIYTHKCIQGWNFEFNSHFVNEMLDITNCGLQTFESVTRYSGSIVKFQGSRNRFVSLNMAFPPGEHLGLLELNLSNNQLSTLHGIERAPNLICLNLSSNRLANQECLVGIANLQALEILDLSENSFGFLDCRRFLPTKTKFLNLSRCSLKRHPIIDCKSLTTLVLDSNGIDHDIIHCESVLTGLENLSLAHNPIIHLSPLNQQLQIDSLDLSNSLSCTESQLVQLLVSCQNVSVLKISPFVLSKNGLKKVCQHLKNISEIDQDENFKYKVFESEITHVQSSFRGARTRSKIESAIMQSKSLRFEDDEEFQEVDIDKFVGTELNYDDDPILKSCESFELNDTIQENETKQEIEIIQAKEDKLMTHFDRLKEQPAFKFLMEQQSKPIIDEPEELDVDDNKTIDSETSLIMISPTKDTRDESIASNRKTGNKFVNKVQLKSKQGAARDRQMHLRKSNRLSSKFIPAWLQSKPKT